MEKLKDFQDLARKNGFLDAEETEQGTVLWLRRPTTNAEDRLCIDCVAKSATLYWATMPWRINSKTFLAVSAMEEWFASTANLRCNDGGSGKVG
jgi:hypothetical protein